MSRQLIKALTLACTIASVVACSDAAQITRALEAPVGESHTVHGPGGKKFMIVEGQLPASVRSASAVIGPEGGTLVLRGPSTGGEPRFHSLTVPAGAVKEPLLFVMELSDREHIEVELSAYRQGGRGKREEVGHLGFRTPVYLTLSYAFAPAGLDPARLSIVHLVGRTVKEQVPSRAENGRRKVVVGALRHFSRYAVAAE